jgi:RNase P subunit RPR2
VTVERVALIPACEECRKVWLPGDDERWKAYWSDNGDEDQLVFYCAECAQREFGHFR